jgi:alkyl sulfatase BDS1-like metallo-beta-lactamase superfamily hydrolase
MTDILKGKDPENSSKNKAFQVIQFQGIEFESPHPDVEVAKILIANASWIRTSEGVVLIDTLMAPKQGEMIKSKMAEKGGELKYIIYTHGHGDHVGGASTLLDTQPEIIAHRYLPERFEKYRILHRYRSRINSIQFNLPFRPDLNPNFVEPTTLMDESMSFKLGDKTFELYHARAETDDAIWVHVPEIKAVFVGDLIVAGFPNIGNPFKPTRFTLSWARALEEMRDKKPELLIAHGGRAVYKGDNVKELLDVTIEAIHSIHDQVVDGINQEIPVDELIHQVKLPEHLAANPMMKFVYSRPEFAVYNIYRWYHGYFDHNPAHLLPRPEKEINAEVFALIGDENAILNRARKLFGEGQTQLALQVLDLLIQNKPEHIEARKLRIELLEKLGEDDYCLMSRNSWIYFIDKDKEFLKEKGQ